MHSTLMKPGDEEALISTHSVSRSVCTMPSADESGGNLVEYPGAQAAQTGQLHLALGLT